MGAKITTEIDPYLKQVFESMKDKLGKITYKDIIEEGILKRIKDIDPVKAEEIEIMQLEFQLSTHKMRLATLKVNAAQLKEKNAVINPELEKKREELFEKERKWVWKDLMLNGRPLNRILLKYEFENKKEAQEWFRPRIERMKELGKIK